MKRIIFTLFMLLGMAVMSYSNDSTYTVSSDRIVTDAYSPQMTLADSTIQYAQSACYAKTTCFNGMVIYCNAHGVGCSWYVQPHQYVSCTGYIGGFWTSVSYSCY
jgi:hypothetical protein